MLTALMEGTTRTAAAASVGIHRDTLYSWIRDDPTFSDEVVRAEAEAQRFYERQIKSAAPQDWRASAFWLERRRRADYGPELNLRNVSTETLRELLPDNSTVQIPKLNDANTIDATFTPADTTTTPPDTPSE